MWSQSCSIIVARVMSPGEESHLGRLTPDPSCSDTVRQRLFAGRMRRVALNDAAPCQSLLQEAQSFKLYCSTKEQGRSIGESIWCASPSDHVYCMSFPLHRSRVIILFFLIFFYRHFVEHRHPFNSTSLVFSPLP